MAHLNESARAGSALDGGGDDTQRKRQSRFQGHWDSASDQPLRQLPPGDIHVEIPPATLAYEWGLLAPGTGAAGAALPQTANGLGALRTLTSTIDDDWSDLLSQRRQLVDIIQGDFPRTPSPSVDAATARTRGAAGPRSGKSPTDAVATAEPHLAGSESSGPASASSAFSALSASAPNRPAIPGHSPSVFPDVDILGISSRRPSVAPSARSHSTAVASGSDTHDALTMPNVGLMVNSLFDAEDEAHRRKSQADVFGATVGPPAGAVAAPGAPPSGQSLWAARHAARLDGFQRAASTPPRHAQVASAGAGADVWGVLNIGAAQQAPGAPLGEPGHPLTPGQLGMGGGPPTADDLSQRIRGLRFDDGGGNGGRGIRSADLQGPHDIFGDADVPGPARSHGPMMASAGEHWDGGPQRAYDGMPMQPQVCLPGHMPGPASAGGAYMDGMMYGGVLSAGTAPGAGPHMFARTQSYTDNRFLRTGPVSAYPLPQPVAPQPGLSGLASAGIMGGFGPQAPFGQAPQYAGHRIHSQPHTPHQGQHMPMLHMPPPGSPGAMRQPLPLQQQPQPLLPREPVMYGTPPPTLVGHQSPMSGTQLMYRSTPKSAAAIESPGHGARSAVLEEF
ncbi:hypothetical protein IWQ57_004516, partial [Coemansia nantahalensis]